MCCPSGWLKVSRLLIKIRGASMPDLAIFVFAMHLICCFMRLLLMTVLCMLSSCGALFGGIQEEKTLC